jgi:prepilin-type N-terminal cleavage/methylation domain-containing protein
MKSILKRVITVSRRRDGFSLIENLVSIAIFSVGIISISMLFTQTLSFSHNSEKFAVAVNYARSQLEMLKNTPYANIQDSDKMTDSKYSKETTIDHVPFMSRWEVSDDDPISGTKRVVMYVSWTDMRKNHTIQLETIFSRY